MNSGSAQERIVRRFEAGAGMSLRGEIAELRRFAYLLASLVRRDLTVRYKRSFLGFLWTMLNPLLMMTIFVIVFSQFFRFAIPHYETYFLSQYLGWTFFAQSTVGAMASMAWNGPLMKRVRVPKTIFTLATTISGFFNLLMAYVALVIVMLVTKAPFRLTALLMPLPLILLFLFTLGVSLAIASSSLYFSDVREMYAVGITALMYLVPTFYPVSIVPERYRWIVLYNPLTLILGIARSLVHDGRLPDATTLVAAIISAVLSMTIGWLIFKRLSKGFFSQL